MVKKFNKNGSQRKKWNAVKLARRKYLLPGNFLTFFFLLPKAKIRRKWNSYSAAHTFENKVCHKYLIVTSLCTAFPVYLELLDN